MKLPLIVFAILLAIIIASKWYNKRPEKPEKTEVKTEKKKTSWGWIIVVILALALAGGYCGYKYLAGPYPAKDAVAAREWMLCWEKIPGATMTTATIQKTMPAVIQKAGNSLTVVYKYGGGKGIMAGVSTDGVSYDGQWEDGVGYGRFHLRFASSDSAVGWVDDKGDKPINLWLVAK